MTDPEKHLVGTRVTDGEVFSMEPLTVTKGQILARLWQLASLQPEETDGRLKGQIFACKRVYEKVRYGPAIQRLNEIANMDPSRTGGRQTDQKTSAKVLNGLVGSIKPCKSGVQ
jgi:hypothetical protein